ncbi:MAG TPA: hypothetical protein DCE43_12185, partial [Planctomycetaceae bacterium]|nr:hypothetical protein [Planctomycetaceae bacterium]
MVVLTRFAGLTLDSKSPGAGSSTELFARVRGHPRTVGHTSDSSGFTPVGANTEGHPGRLTPPHAPASATATWGRYGDWRLV